MLYLITTFEYSKIQWLHQFVAHYRKLNVDRFLISLHVEADTPGVNLPEIHEQGRRIFRSAGVDLTEVLVCPFDAMNLRRHHNFLQEKFCDDDDWIVWADSDEFQEYPSALNDLLKAYNGTGVNIIGGEFLDRISADGTLAPFDPHLPVWDQYPLGCYITNLVLKAQTNKTVCSKAGVRIKFGNHDPIEGQELSWARETAVVHHFKWDATVVERLRRRLTPEWKARCPWWDESQRAIEHITKYGRIDLETVKAFPVYRQERQNKPLVSFP